jgi:hypothetical protein
MNKLFGFANTNKKNYILIKNPLYRGALTNFNNFFTINNNSILKRSSYEYYCAIGNNRLKFTEILQKNTNKFFNFKKIFQFFPNKIDQISDDIIYNRNNFRNKINRRSIFLYLIIGVCIVFEFYKEEIKYLLDKAFKYVVVDYVCKNKIVQDKISVEILNLVQKENINNMLVDLIIKLLKRDDLKNDLKRIIHKSILDYISSENCKKVKIFFIITHILFIIGIDCVDCE